MRAREIYFKELAHVIIEAVKSKLCRKGWQAGDLLQLESEGSLKIFPLSWGTSVFFFIRPSADFIRPSHIMKGISSYPEHNDLNVSFI